MQLDLEKGDSLIIRSFSAGEIRINDQVVTTHIILAVDKIIGEWTPPPIEKLSIADFRLPLEHDPEVILFGTGLIQRFPKAELITDVLRRGVGFEVMATGAACRTFNVLASERRRVIAALLVR